MSFCHFGISVSTRSVCLEFHLVFILNVRFCQIVSESMKNGNVIARARATDADAGANAVLTYSLEGDPNEMFSITPETGEIRLEKTRIESASYDVNKETVDHLVVVATDGGEVTFRIPYYYYYYYY